MNKYRNKPCVYDGRRFASIAESRRYHQLQLLLRAGEITKLEFQPRFDLAISHVVVCKYFADFSYIDVKTGETVIEDVKGIRTPVYRLKKKLMKVIHGIEITEIMA